MRSVTARTLSVFAGGALSVLAASALAGCAKDVKPTGPVLSPYERARDFSKASASGASYSSQPPLTNAVVPPFMGFGASFDLDIALGLKDNRADMIEIARLQTPEGPLWIALESEAGSGAQTVIASLEDIDTWMPELPVARKNGGLQVQDRTTADGLDLTVKYTNPDNLPVELVLQGEPPESASKKRNGNTMGHGANEMLAVLDVSSMESLFKADVRVDDQNVRIRKIAGIVPFQYTLTQTQGGLAIGEYTVEQTGEVPFEKNADYKKPYKWTPPPPPPEPEPFPAPLNVPGDDGPVLLPMDQWTPIAKDAKKTAIDAQPSKLDACLLAAQATDPEFVGIVAVDFHVKATDAWTITADPASTAPNLVIQCVQQIVDGWTFDEKLDGSMRVMVARLPVEHEPANDLEKGWMDAEAARLAEEAKKNGGKKPPVAPKEEEKPKDIPAGEDLLSDDLMADDPDAMPIDAKPSRFPPLGVFETIHNMPNGDKVAQGWNVKRDGGKVFVTQDSGARRLVYEYLVNGPALELRSVTVESFGKAVPAFAMTFTPPMPDLRIPFSGKITSKFVIDVGGQQNHATGTAVSSFADAGAKVVITPSAPDWAVSRPLTSTVSFDDGKAIVRTRMGN